MLNEANEAYSVASVEQFNENGSSGLMKEEIILLGKFNYRPSSRRFGQRDRRLGRASNCRRSPRRPTGGRTLVVDGHICNYRRYHRTDKRLLFKWKCKKRSTMVEEETNQCPCVRGEMWRRPNRLTSPSLLPDGKQRTNQPDNSDELTTIRSTDKRDCRPAGTPAAVYLSDGKLDQTLVEKPDERSLIRTSSMIADELNLDKSIKKCSPTIASSSSSSNWEGDADRPTSELPSSTRANRIGAKRFTTYKQQPFTVRCLLFFVRLLICHQSLFGQALATDLCLENCNCIYSKNKFIADCSALALENLPMVSSTKFHFPIFCLPTGESILFD